MDEESRVLRSLDFLQKGDVYLGGAFLAPGGFRVPVERAFEYGVLGEYGNDFIPDIRITVVGVVFDAGDIGIVRVDGFNPAVIYCEFLEIGQDAQGKFGRPCIASQLVGGVRIILDVH